MKQDCFEIGKIIKTHGIHGELIIEINNPAFIENIKESVFLEIDGILVPFFISEVKTLNPQRIRTKFDWIDTENKAKTFVGSPIFIENYNIELSKDLITDQFDLLKGFLVTDKKYGILGLINNVLTTDVNPLLSVNFKNHEILIPIHPDFIHDINQKNKTILIECPEGLIDLYLE